MKIAFTHNGKERGLGTLAALFDFFFPVGNHIRMEMSASRKGDEEQENTFFTFRTFAKHYAGIALKSFLGQFRGYKAWNREQLLNGNALRWQAGNIAYGTVSGIRTEATGTTQSVTITASGSDRGAVAFSAQTHYASGITYDSTSMTSRVQTQGGGGYNIDGYTLIAPSTTSGATVTVTWGTTGTGRVLVCQTYSGVHQTTMHGNTASGFSLTTSAASVNITTTVNQSFVTAFMTGHGNYAPANTVLTGVGTGQTQDYVTNGAGNDLAATSYKQYATAGATSMSWTFTGSPSYMEMVVIEVVTAGETPSPNWLLFF